MKQTTQIEVFLNETEESMVSIINSFVIYIYICYYTLCKKISGMGNILSWIHEKVLMDYVSDEIYLKNGQV